MIRRTILPVAAALSSLLWLSTILASASLLFFSLRRAIFLMAAALPPRPPRPGPTPNPITPSVLLLVPFRNEAASLPGLLHHLDQLDYPAGQCHICLIDDASDDDSPALALTWAARRPQRTLLRLPQRQGKAAALNYALAHCPPAGIIAVYDADERPAASALRQLVQPFARPQVGAVSGLRTISNPLASPAATYATLESLLHQQITLRAKERLGLAPPLLGANCAYRRAALLAVGGFPAGALLEDSHLTLRLTLAGWQTRFAPAATSHHAVPHSLAGYWHQHTRWADGFQAVAGHYLRTIWHAHHLPWPLRLELLAFAAGYLDRPALLLALLTLLARRLLTSQWSPRLAGLIFTALLLPWLQLPLALRHARAPRALWQRLYLVPLFFPLDVAMALAGHSRRRRRRVTTWEPRETPIARSTP